MVKKNHTERGNFMSFNDREKAFENKFSMDQESMFKIEARASKLIGLWVAEKLGFSGDAANNYAKEVITSNLDEPGYDDVKRKVMGDLAARGVSVSDDELNAVIEKSITEATHQITPTK